MNTWLNVARYHLLQRLNYLVLPWAALAFGAIADVMIFASLPASQHVMLTGHGPVLVTNTASRLAAGALSIFCAYVFTMGVISTGRSLPFGLALGVSRRSYYTGTALLAVTLAAADGLALTVLQAIERATDGWGVNGRVFQVPYILDGPWYLTWLTSSVALALLFVYGMWWGTVYRRWGLVGTVAFAAAQITVLLAAALLIAGVPTWASTGHFFAALSAARLTGLLAALTAVLLAGGYATIRRVAV